MFDECVMLLYNRNITCFPCFINFESEFGCDLWSLGGKLCIDQMREFREENVKMTYFLLMNFNVRMT